MISGGPEGPPGQGHAKVQDEGSSEAKGDNEEKGSDQEPEKDQKPDASAAAGQSDAVRQANAQLERLMAAAPPAPSRAPQPGLHKAKAPAAPANNARGPSFDNPLLKAIG